MLAPLAGRPPRCWEGVPVAYAAAAVACWSTILVAESDSQVKVNWVLGVALGLALVAE